MSMQTITAIKCPSCGFPISTSIISFTCPNCGVKSSLEVAMRGKGTTAEVSALGTRISGNGVDWAPALIAFALGVVLGPAILVSSREGAERLARMAQEKLKK